MRINVKSLSKYIATVFVSVVVTYTIIKMSDSNTEITATQPPVKPISPVAAVDEKSDVIPTAAEAATRNAQWDCELYFCKEGDLPIYPRPTLVTNDIATLSFRTIPKLSNDNPNLVVIFDPTCPRCKAYYRDTLRQLSEQGNVIRIIPTLYKDRLTDKDYTAVHRLLCAESVKAGIEDIVYGRKESVEQCPISLSQVKQSIDKTRKSLSKHQLHTMAPISVSPKALWFGNLPISTVTKYL